MDTKCRSPQQVLVLASVILLSVPCSQYMSATALAGEPSPPVDLLGDPVPRAAIARIGTSRFRHHIWVSQLVFAPDGKHLASTGGDNALRLWDVSSGKQVWVQKPAKEEPGEHPASFNSNGTILTWAASGSVFSIDVRTGRIIHQFRDNFDATSLRYTADDKRLAISGRNLGNQIGLIDARTGKSQKTFQVPAGAAQFPYHFDATVSVDGKLAAAPYREINKEDFGAGVWEVATGKLVLKLPAVKGQDSASDFAFSHDGKYLASGGRRWVLGQPERLFHQVNVWSLAAGKRVLTLPGDCSDFVFSPDGKTLASSGFYELVPSQGWTNGSVRLWDLTSGKERSRIRIGSVTDQVTALAFAPDGRTLATGTQEGSIRLWDIASGKELVPLPDFHTRPHLVGFLGTSATTVLVNAGTGLDYWELSPPARPKQVWAAKRERRVEDLFRLVYDFGLAHDRKIFVARDYNDDPAIWNVAEGKKLFALPGTSFNSGIAFAPDGRTLAILQSGKVSIWDAHTGKQVSPPSKSKQDRGFVGGTMESGTAIAFSQDSKTVVSLDRDENLLSYWDPATGKKLRQVVMGEKPKDEPCGTCGNSELRLAFSPVRSILAVGGPGGKVRLWDTLTDRLLFSFPGRVFAFAPAGNVIAVGDDDGLVKVWSVATGKQVNEYTGHSGPITRIAFSADGRRLASGSLDHTIVIWNLRGR